MPPCKSVQLDRELIIFKHGSYDELVKEHQVTYVAGGAAQNTARGAAVGPPILRPQRFLDIFLFSMCCPRTRLFILDV
jgi:hypothetical protein